MKRSYSEYVFDKNLALARRMTDDELRRILHSAWVDGVVPPKEVRLMYDSTRMECLVKEGKCMHYFFTGEGMHDWLSNCATDFTDEHMSVIKNIPIEGVPFESETKDREFVAKVFMLHFLGGNSPCYLCMALLEKNGWWACYVTDARHNTVYFTQTSKKDVFNPLEKMVGTVASAISYVKCFPDTVINGVPADVKHPNHFKGVKSKSIGMHESLVVRDGPSPHYRSGHFRYLEAERFKKARFTTVFVHGTFVKGKSKVVLSPEDSEKDVVILEGV